MPLLLVGVAALFFHWNAAGIVLVLLALFVFSFFRDPDRVIPSEPGAVVSPGDGRVVVIQDEEYAGRPGRRVSIFLAVWNVHVNRAPSAGVITKLEYRPGKFFAAMQERASTENEQNIFTLSGEAGELVWIAGGPVGSTGSADSRETWAERKRRLLGNCELAGPGGSGKWRWP